MKITKSRLIQIIKEEVDKERVNREKEDLVKSFLKMAAANPDGKLKLGQLRSLFPKSDPKDIKTKLEELEKSGGYSYGEALKYLLDQEPAIDPEGNPLEFSS